MFCCWQKGIYLLLVSKKDICSKAKISLKKPNDLLKYGKTLLECTHEVNYGR